MIFPCIRFKIYLPLCRQVSSVLALQLSNNLGCFMSHPISTNSGRYAYYEPYVNNALDMQQCSTLKKFGITDQDCQKYPKILYIHPQTIEHHGLVLLEGGFKKVNASLILSYFKFVRKTVHVLKLHGHMNSETSVAHSFLQQVSQFPAHEFELDKLDETHMKFIDIYDLILKQFLIWRLETTESELLRIMKTYQRIKHRSLRYISWTIDILETELGFSKEKIINNGYLIHSYPPNTLDTLKRVPVLCGKDIKTVLNRFPKIIMSATDSLIEIDKLLKAHGVSDIAVFKRGDVFTLGVESVKKRLMKVHVIPEFKAYSESPNVIQLVHYQRKASQRILHLKELQRQCMSVHVLTSPNSYFERYTQESEDRSSGSDIIGVLSPKLEVNGSTLRKTLRLHPFWCHVPVTSLVDTLNVLREMGYDKADITKNVHLLLYRAENVKDVLTSLHTRQEIIEAQSLTEKNLASSPSRKCIELALCLYFLEREHHFTGNGMWSV